MAGLERRDDFPADHGRARMHDRIVELERQRPLQRFGRHLAQVHRGIAEAQLPDSRMDRYALGVFERDETGVEQDGADRLVPGPAGILLSLLVPDIDQFRHAGR